MSKAFEAPPALVLQTYLLCVLALSLAFRARPAADVGKPAAIRLLLQRLRARLHGGHRAARSHLLLHRRQLQLPTLDDNRTEAEAASERQWRE